MKLLSTIKVFAFWGICFLLILVIGFGVKSHDIISIATSLEMNLAAFCIYILGSVIIFPLLAIISMISLLKSGLSFGDVLAINISPLLWTPYKGLDIRELFKLKKLGLDARGILHDIMVHIRRFLEMTLWWFIVVFGLYTIYHQGNNAIRSAIDQKSFSGKATIVGICLAVYLVLQLFSWVVNKVVTKKWRNEVRRSSSDSGTRAQRYYDRHPERIPSGCRACGGPYPECKASCNLYDD